MDTDQSRQLRVAFAGGWSAGHVTPGLAVAEELSRRCPFVEPFFFGADDPLERELVRRRGFEFFTVAASPWAGRRIPGKALALARLVPAFVAAQRTLRRIDARLVVGLGSHISIAPVLAARRLGIPALALESNATIGLANRLLVRFVKRLYVCPDFEIDDLGTARDRVVAAPLPIRSEIRALETVKRKAPGPGEALRVFVTGGSRGAPFLNRMCPDLFARLRDEGTQVKVLHQAGPNGALEEVRGRYRSAGVNAEVVSFCDPITKAYCEADFAITAAGAITLAELAAAGLPSLVVPVSGTAHGHQLDTARRFEAASRCLMRDEDSWKTNEVAAEIGALLKDASRWESQVRGMRAARQAETGADLAGDCLALLEKER